MGFPSPTQPCQTRELSEPRAFLPPSLPLRSQSGLEGSIPHPAGCVQGGGKGSRSCADTCAPGCAREALLPLRRTSGQESEGRVVPFTPTKSSPALPHQAPVSRQGTGRHRPAVTPSATPLGARTGPGSPAGIPFTCGRSPLVKAQVGGLRPSPYGPPTAGLVPPCGLCPDSSLESNCV